MQSSIAAIKETPSSLPLATSPDAAAEDVQLYAHQQSIAERMPDEILQYFIFSQLDPKSLLFTVPQVSKQWRRVCQLMKDVHLDLGSWLATNMMVPVEALAGWRQTPMMLDSGAGEGWTTGLCALFPFATKVTLGTQRYNYASWTRDEHLAAVAANCPGIKHATINCCRLSHDGVMAFADKYPDLTHALMYQCHNLEDETLIELGKKCRGITQIAFTCLDDCGALSAEAVSEFADECPELTHADFNECSFLTQEAMIALADKCSGLTHVVVLCKYTFNCACL